MKYEVFLTVRGEQEYDGGETDKIELTADGTLEDTADGWVLSYDEQETHTAFLIGARRTVLRRSGTVKSEMIFEEGETHTSVYELPYGTLTLATDTDSIRQKLSERGGLLEIRYRITVGEQVRSKNSFKIRIRRKI